MNGVPWENFHTVVSIFVEYFTIVKKKALYNGKKIKFQKEKST